MADPEETFVLQNSPTGSESREVPNENKPEKQNGTSKSPSSQTTYIQQVCLSELSMCYSYTVFPVHLKNKIKKQLLFVHFKLFVPLSSEN